MASRDQQWAVCQGGPGAFLGPATQARVSPPPAPALQISTQRTVNIYGILQEVIQQEGELEERCVQRLVAIASKDMREILEVAEPWAPLGFQPTANPGRGCWWARPGMPKALSSYLVEQKRVEPKGAQQGWSRRGARGFL